VSVAAYMDQLQRKQRLDELRELKFKIFKDTILDNPYIPHKPHPKQAEFLLFEGKEGLYGGAAGGGKSDCLLMAALRYVQFPNYNAILFRRTFSDLSLPGAIMDRAKEWLLGKNGVHWSEKEHRFTFPSKSTLSFGYLEHEDEKLRYQGAEFQFIGFDELTQFSETQYTYLFSRLRKNTGNPVPLFMRSASNPGGKGHEWVFQRFMVEGKRNGRLFVSAKLGDNPSLNREEYEVSLANLDPITRLQLLNGDWNARHGGSLFVREKALIVPMLPAGLRFVRFWDKAATAPKKKNKDPDWTVGVKLAERQGVYYVADVRRLRGVPSQVQALIKQTAVLDGFGVPIYMEQEPGSSGVDTIDHYTREVLKGYAFYGVKSSGSKTERAAPVSSAWDAGNFRLLQAPWNSAFLDELEAFPLGGHDDQVDATSGAFRQIQAYSSNNMPVMFAVNTSRYY